MQCRECLHRLVHPLGDTSGSACLLGYHQLLEGLRGVYVIADDILVAGEGLTIAVAEQDHNQKLHTLLKQCNETGIKLNKDKFCLRLQTLVYMGHLLMSDGLMADPQKIRCHVLLTSLGYVEFWGWSITCRDSQTSWVIYASHCET